MPNSPAPNFIPLRFNSKIYGWILLVSSLLALLFISHHPVADMRNPAQAIENMAAVRVPAGLIHGALIVIVLMFAIGFTGFAARLGFFHPLVMSAWLAYVFGIIFMIGAALIDGFVLADIAQNMSNERQLALSLINYSLIINQALAKLGFVFMALGALLWGVGLLHFRGINRFIGLTGFVLGGASIGFVLLTPQRFDVALLFSYMIFQMAWHFIVAIWMIRSTDPIMTR